MEGVHGFIVDDEFSEINRLSKIVRKKLETTRILLTASRFLVISSAVLVVAKIARIVPIWKPAVFMVVGFIVLLICDRIIKQAEKMNKRRKVLIDSLYVGIERKN